MPVKTVGRGECLGCGGTFVRGEKAYFEKGSRDVWHLYCAPISDYPTIEARKKPGGWLELSFPYNKELVSMVKSLPQRRYDPKTKTWFVKDDGKTKVQLGAYIKYVK